MSEFLIEHALQNVWCAPEQDTQFIVKLHRISKKHGSRNHFNIFHTNIPLPSKNNTYHVFNIGQLSPGIVGLLEQSINWVAGVWKSFKYTINNSKVFVDLYTSYGLELPKFNTFYMFTTNRSLIIAVESLDKIFFMDYINDLYLRLYTNAYFLSSRADSALEYLKTNGLVIRSAQDIITLKTEYELYDSKEGHVYCYQNGYYIDSINDAYINVGDVVEYVYDSSVKRVDNYSITDLQLFHSKLDKVAKYILHSNTSVTKYEDNKYVDMDESLNNCIDYVDDIDIHIYIDNSNAVNGVRYKGFYYNRNSDNSHRMLTHKDYSVPISFIRYVSEKLIEKLNNPFLTMHNLKIEVKVRDAGYKRLITYDQNRIFELHHLDNNVIVNALTGINSTMDIWKASHLEDSMYLKIMRLFNTKELTSAIVEEAYGYNSISKILLKSPIKLTGTANTINIPPLLQSGCTVYEYDTDGVYTNSFKHISGTTYTVRSGTKAVELINGFGSQILESIFVNPLPNNLTTIIRVVNNVDFQIYKCLIINGVPNNSWENVTGDTNHYTYDELETITWNNSNVEEQVMVRTNKNFLSYSINILPTSGLITFNLSENINSSIVDLKIPLGELVIFLNGKSLIENIDYKIQFPKVVVINKQYLKTPASTTVQKIHIRYTGLSTKTSSKNFTNSSGFIEHGLVSDNDMFNINSDKNIRVAVNGCLKLKEDILFSETNDGIDIGNVNNGKPYSVQEIVVPLKHYVSTNTYSLKAKSEIIDKKVSEYLTFYLRKINKPDINPIVNKHVVYSPLLSKLIEELNLSYLVVDKELSDMEVVEITEPYLNLLPFEPVTLSSKIDSRYITVHPHISTKLSELDMFQFNYLLAVNRLYLNDSIDLVTFSQLNP